MTINDGGPAFPFPADTREFAPSVGMSLRDYFAAKAATALLMETEREWNPTKADLLEDAEGTWWTTNERPFPFHSNVVPTWNLGEEEKTSLKRWREKNTWRDRLWLEAYAQADAGVRVRGGGL